MCFCHNPARGHEKAQQGVSRLLKKNRQNKINKRSGRGWSQVSECSVSDQSARLTALSEYFFGTNCRKRVTIITALATPQCTGLRQTFSPCCCCCCCCFLTLTLVKHLESVVSQRCWSPTYERVTYHIM